MTRVVKWLSPVTTCNICGRPIGRTFVDGKTITGPRALMCPTCHEDGGIGLGTGRGQKYERNEADEFIKIEG